MPVVTSKEPSAVSSGLQGVTSAFTGAAQGEAAKVEEGRFQQDFSERARQFDADLDFKIKQLLAMQEEGRLDRGQQERLLKVQEQYTLQRQATDVAAGLEQQGRAQSFQRGESVLDRDLNRELTAAQLRQSNIENTRNNATERYGIKSRQDQELAKQADERRLRNLADSVDQGNRILARFGKSNFQELNSQEQQEAINLLAQQIVSPARWTSSAGAAAATAEEKALAFKEAANQLAGHTARKESLFQEAERMAVLEQRARVDPASRSGVGQQSGVLAKATAADLIDYAGSGNRGPGSSDDVWAVANLPSWNYLAIQRDPALAGLDATIGAYEDYVALDLAADAERIRNTVKDAGLLQEELSRLMVEAEAQRKELLDSQLGNYHPDIQSLVKDRYDQLASTVIMGPLAFTQPFEAPVSEQEIEFLQRNGKSTAGQMPAKE